MAESYVRIAGTVTGKGQEPMDISQNIECDGVSKVEVTIEGGAVDEEVLLSPAGSASAVVVASIKADSYPETVPGTPDLGFKVSADTNTEIPLSGPQLFVDGQDEGLGAAGLAFDKIFVSNAGAEDVVLTVLVAFNALP